MNNRLLWAAVVVIVVVAGIFYFVGRGTTSQAPEDRPSPHAINQGNG